MKTVVALYDHLSDANATVRDLVDYGLSRDQISLMAHDKSGNYSSHFAGTSVTTDAIDSTASGAATGAGIGAIVGGLGGLLVGLGVLVIPGVGPVLAAGPLATAISALTGAGVGAMAGGAAGGLLGALVDLGLPEETAGNYAEGIRRGGILITARTEDHQAEDVRRIMNRHNVINIDERVRGWREQGWTGYREVDVEAQAVSTASRDYSSTTVGDVNSQLPQGIATGGDQYQSPQRTDQPLGMAGDTTNYEIDPAVPGVSTYAAQGIPTGRSPMDNDEQFRRFNPIFEQHYNTNYSNRGRDFDYYLPGYYYGYRLANEDRYRDWTWDDIEPEARREWELRNDIEGTWEDFKDVVHDAWVRVREGVREALD